jgi:cytochrome c556
MLPGRAKDKGEWMKNAKALVDAGSAAFKAANVKDANALTDSGDKIDESCETCHAKYLPKQ